MKYFRIGYCKPSPGMHSSPYLGDVKAFSEENIQQAIEYAKTKPNLPVYMKKNYGARYEEITLEQLLNFD